MQIILIIPNQLVQICDDFFNIYQHLPVRTLQQGQNCSLSCMGHSSCSQEDDQPHAGQVQECLCRSDCFLNTQIVDINHIGSWQPTKVASVGNKVGKLETGIINISANIVNKGAMDNQDHKLQSIVHLNNELKKNTNSHGGTSVG